MEEIELNAHGKLVFKHKTNRNLFLHREYNSIDTITLVDEREDRQVIMSFKYSTFNLSCWEAVTIEEENLVRKSYIEIYERDNIKQPNYKLIPIDVEDDLVFDNIDARILSYYDKYTGVGRVSDILKDEEICKTLVESINVCDGHFSSKKSHKEYINYLGGHYYLSAIESFQSWLKSIGLDMNKQWLMIVLKKI